MSDERDQSDPPASRSGRVRIVGAERAGHREEPPEAIEAEAGDTFASTALPHWTEPPTGEVPAILHRGDDERDDDPWASISGPTWREEESDWDASGEAFEPAMLADDEPRLGSLDDSGETDRQPWSFELDEQEPLEDWARADAEVAAFEADDTMVVPLSSLEETGALSEEAVAPQASRLPFPPPPEIREPSTESRAGRFSVHPDDLAPDDEPGLRRLTGGPDAAPAAPRRPRLAEDALSTRPARPRPMRREPTNGAARSRPRGAGGPPPELPERDSRSGRNMPVAIVTGVALGAAMLILFKVGTVAAMVIVVATVVLAAAEAFAAFRHAGYQPATLFGLVATVSVMVGTYNKGQAALPLVLIMLFAFTLLWYMIGVERGADPVRGSAATLFVFCWVGGFGSYAALLLSPSLFPNRHGIAFLLGAVVCAVGYDVGALAVGAWIGRRPLAPSISPTKTWEGAIGGALCAIVAAVVVVHFIHPWTLSNALLLGVIVAIVSPLGDLCESLVKRHLGLKDMGTTLPGHGGFLDRVDGLLFVLPATFYLVKAVHLG